MKFTGTASTYPFRSFSHASRSLELRPYTSSPATHANGTPAPAAPATIAVPSAGLVVNGTSSGTRASPRSASNALMYANAVKRDLACANTGASRPRSSP